MKNLGMNSSRRVALLTACFMAASCCSYAAGGAVEPRLAAKREMVRKQQEQRITPAKRKAAAEALKAERMKVYQARQAAHLSTPAAIEIK